MRQMGGDPRPREIGEGRGAGDAKAAAERQPRRGMFDGLKLSAEPAKAAEPAQGAKEKAAPKRGMFDGLKLSSRTPTPAKEAPARAGSGRASWRERVCHARENAGIAESGKKNTTNH